MPLKNSSLVRDSGKRPAEVISSLSGNISNLGGEHYLTDRELSQRLKISRRTLQDYRNNGILPYRQLGGKILYRESDIERVLQSCYRGKF